MSVLITVVSTLGLWFGITLYQSTGRTKRKAKEIKMAKVDVVAAQKAAYLAAQDAVIETALEATYDAAVADQPVSTGTGGFTQADIDAAVLAAQGVDAQALADAQAKALADIGAVQQALTDMTAKEQMEESAVAAVQQSVLAVQASFDAIKALLLPATPVAPVPAA